MSKDYPACTLVRQVELNLTFEISDKMMVVRGVASAVTEKVAEASQEKSVALGTNLVSLKHWYGYR